MAVTVPQPEVAATYYSCAAQIDQQNRCRQEYLRLEQKFVTHDWSQRVNLSLLGMCLVDTWISHTGARGPAATLKQAAFHQELAIGLIDNSLDTTGHRPRGEPSAAVAAAAADQPPAVYGVSTHFAPTTKRRRSTGSGPSSHLAQRDCRV